MRRTAWRSSMASRNSRPRTGSPASEIHSSKAMGRPARDAAPASQNRQRVNRQNMPKTARSAALGLTRKPNFRRIRSSASMAAARSARRSGPPESRANRCTRSIQLGAAKPGPATP